MSYYPSLAAFGGFVAVMALLTTFFAWQGNRIDKLIDAHREWHKKRFERGVGK